MNTGCQEAVLLLLERGADIDAVVRQPGRRRGAWSGARRCGSGGGASEGRQGGRNVHIFKALGAGPEGWMLRAFREAETPVLSQDIKSGRSPLIHAVENNSLNMVQLLLLVSTHLWLLPCLAPIHLLLPPLACTPFSNSNAGCCSVSDSDSSLQHLICNSKFVCLSLCLRKSLTI